MQTRIFEVFSDGTNVFTGSFHDAGLVYLITVRARSARQAFWLAANRVLLNDSAGGVGIINVEHADGAEAAQDFFAAKRSSHVGGNRG